MAELPTLITDEPIETDWGNLIQERVIQRYADTSERTSEHGTPAQGDLSFLDSDGKIYVYYSSSWQAIQITSADDVPDLPASKITSGTLADARIPSLNASKITSGTFSTSRIPNLAASKITSGSFNADRIPNLNASKITAGTFPIARLPYTSSLGSLSSANVASGSLIEALYGLSVRLADAQTITGVKTFTTQPQFNAGIDIPGSGTIDQHWPGLRRINDSAWGSIRLEGDNGYRMYFHTSTKYVKEAVEAISVERSREAIRILQPVTYDSNGKRNIGFVAENVQEAEPLTAPPPRETENGPDEVPTYSEDGIIAHLVGAVQDLLDRVDQLEAQLAS